jgi:signal transduction histidine kinase
MFEIKISDNGKGFVSPIIDSKQASPATASAASGDGLNNMCQRLTDFGGRCRIESTPGRGTNIQFVIPLNFSSKDV